DFIGKINPLGRRDLPKDVFVLLIVILVGVGAFFLGKMFSIEEKRASELRLIQTGGSPSGGFEVGEGKVVNTVQVPITASSTAGAGGGEEAERPNTVPALSGAYVASKHGEAYYLPWCGGVKLIREENKIWFATKEEAEARGYRPAANCKGL
ncbi:MAG TPA: hypothetical protein VJZ94_03470, partial [Candidatus Paceibacterota bacterium]|nr:hypothetical protein [Candidatus Paceibacterota bacterium]